MDVRLPDGTIVKNVPDGISKGELVDKLVASGYAKSIGINDYKDELPSKNVGTRLLEGVGQGMNSLYQGVKQRMGMVSPQEVEDTRKTDAPLLNTGAGVVGSVIGQAAPAIALSMLPGANTAVGSVLVGGTMGAAQPTTADEDVGTNIVKSGLFSLGGHLLGKSLLGPIKNRNASPRQNLIDTARGKYKIDLPASTQLNNKPLAYVESQLAVTPGGGRMGELYQRGNEQFARAVMREAGAPGELATQGALATAKKGTQKAYEQIWSNNLVKADQRFLDDLIDARNLAGRTLEPGKVRVVERQIENILDKVKPGDVIDGDVYQMFLRPELRIASSGDSALKEPLKAVKRALDNAAMRSLNQADVDAVQRLNYTYAVQKQLQKTMGAAEARGGTFTPSAVKGAIDPNMRGNIQELAKIGQLLREPPQSGTVPRAVSQYLLTGVPSAGVGAAAGYDQGGTSGALKGAGLGMLAPMAASRVLSSPAAQGYLARGILPTTMKQQEALLALLRGGATAAPMLINATQQ